MPIFEIVFSSPLPIALTRFWAACSRRSFSSSVRRLAGAADAPFDDHLVERLEQQVRVDRARAVADQRGEVVDLARLAGLDDDPGAQARALEDEMVVHGRDRQQRGDRHAARSEVAVVEDDDVHALRDRLARQAADALDRGAHPGGPLGDRPGDVDRLGFVDIVVDVSERLQLAVEQDRLFEQQLVCVLGRLVEQVALIAQAGREAHHDLLADRVDRRVGDLGEELLEVGEQRRRLVGEDRQRDVVAHRSDRLGAVGGHRCEQHPQVLLGVAERALAQAQGLVGERHLLGRRQVAEMHRVALEPLAVGVRRGDLALDLLVLDDAPALEVDEEQLAGLQPPEAPHLLGRDVEQAGLRAQHDVPVGRLHPAARAQAVAVERRADHAAVGERDRGGSVPRLHQARVERVEALQVLGKVRAAAVGLGDHHHRGVRQRAAGEQEQLEHVVEGGRIGVAGRHDRQDLAEVLAEQLAAQLALPRAHPVDVAHHRVDLAVVADHAVGVGELPARERVGGEARVHERERALGALVTQVAVEGRELEADQHALVVDRARGARGHVQSRLLCASARRSGGSRTACARTRPGRPGSAGPAPTNSWRITGLQAAATSPVCSSSVGTVAPAEQPLALPAHGRARAALQAARAGPARWAGSTSARRRRRARGSSKSTTARSSSSGICMRMPAPSPVHGIGTRGAAMLEVLERRDRPCDHLVRRPVVQARDHAHAARVVLEAGVVKAYGLRRLRDVRSHGSAPVGRCIPRSLETPPAGVPPWRG